MRRKLLTTTMLTLLVTVLIASTVFAGVYAFYADSCPRCGETRYILHYSYNSPTYHKLECPIDGTEYLERHSFNSAGSCQVCGKDRANLSSVTIVETE